MKIMAFCRWNENERELYNEHNDKTYIKTMSESQNRNKVVNLKRILRTDWRLGLAESNSRLDYDFVFLLSSERKRSRSPGFHVMSRPTRL